MTKAGLQLTNTIREVRATDTTRGVLMRRDFPATVDQLWNACTDPDSLARWIGQLKGDPADGRFELIMVGDCISSCEVLRCEAPRHLELIWTVDGESSVVTAMINETSGGAELTIEHLALRKVADLGYGPRWEELMIDLGEFLDGEEKSHDCEAAEKDARGLWRDVSESQDDRFGHIDSDGRYIKINNFATPPHEVWQALTTASGLGGWFGETSGDLERGGSWRVSFGDGHVTGTVTACQPETSFTTTFVQGIDDASISTHSIEVTLALGELPVGGGTRLTLTHTFADGTDEGVRRGMAAGWHAYLAALGRRLAAREASEDAWMVDYRVAGMVGRPSTSSASGSTSSAAGS